MMMKRIFRLPVRHLALALVGVLSFVSLSFVSTSARADITQVNPAQLEELRKQGVVLVDIRTEREWRDTGVIEGSHTLTFFDERYRYDAPAWLAALEEIAPGDTPILLICESGVRTKSISQFLDQKVGRQGVHNLTRGIRDWLNRDNPVDTWPAAAQPEASNAATGN